jgi:hypothetical protein
MSSKVTISVKNFKRLPRSRFRKHALNVQVMNFFTFAGLKHIDIKYDEGFLPLDH